MLTLMQRPQMAANPGLMPNGGRFNMSAYGGTVEASLSPLLQTYLPSKAYNPSPADGANGVGFNISLSWTVRHSKNDFKQLNLYAIYELTWGLYQYDSG